MRDMFNSDVIVNTRSRAIASAEAFCARKKTKAVSAAKRNRNEEDDDDDGERRKKANN